MAAAQGIVVLQQRALRRRAPARLRSPRAHKV
jgi:hypothetical protein